MLIKERSICELSARNMIILLKSIDFIFLSTPLVPAEEIPRWHNDTSPPPTDDRFILFKLKIHNYVRSLYQLVPSIDMHTEFENI